MMHSELGLHTHCTIICYILHEAIVIYHKTLWTLLATVSGQICLYFQALQFNNGYSK